MNALIRARATRWIVVALVVLAAVLAYRHFELGRLLTLDGLKAARDGLVGAYAARPIATGEASLSTMP